MWSKSDQSDLDWGGWLPEGSQVGELVANQIAPADPQRAARQSRFRLREPPPVSLRSTPLPRKRGKELTQVLRLNHSDRLQPPVTLIWRDKAGR